MNEQTQRGPLQTNPPAFSTSATTLLAPVMSKSAMTTLALHRGLVRRNSSRILVLTHRTQSVMPSPCLFHLQRLIVRKVNVLHDIFTLKNVRTDQ